MTAEQAKNNVEDFIKYEEKMLMWRLKNSIEDLSKQGYTNMPVRLKESLLHKQEEVIQHFTSLGYKVTKEPLSRIRISWA